MQNPIYPMIYWDYKYVPPEIAEYNPFLEICNPELTRILEIVVHIPDSKKLIFHIFWKMEKLSYKK